MADAAQAPCHRCGALPPGAQGEDDLLCGSQQLTATVELCCAIARGDLHQVQRMLARRVYEDGAFDIHAMNGEPLAIACRWGHVDIVKALLAIGHGRRPRRYEPNSRPIDVHGFEEWPFLIACAYGHLPVVDELLELTGKRTINVHARRDAPFHAACREGHLPVVQRLMQLPGRRSIPERALVEGFSVACSSGQLHVVEYLLELTGKHHINVHYNNDYPFHGACEKGHLPVVERLLQLTGDRRISENCIRRASRYATPHVAAWLAEAGYAHDDGQAPQQQQQ